jgi:predicted DCC family thiol-disulfide oxidoreductase YuxK
MTAGTGDIVLFDGVCELCTHSVKFILRRERTDVIRFVPLQSKVGHELLRGFGIDPEGIATFVFITKGKIYLRSDALVEIVQHLRMPWRMLGWLGVVPRPLRDAVYDFIARNRYRWFGQRETCMMPTPELRARFLDEAGTNPGGGERG